jgi:hypothetical protein
MELKRAGKFEHMPFPYNIAVLSGCPSHVTFPTYSQVKALESSVG